MPVILAAGIAVKFAALAAGNVEGNRASAIVTEKQRLRDITNQVDSMTTTDELKAATVEA